MSLFVGQIIRTLETREGRDGVASVRGAHRVVVLDAVPHARTGDAVLVEAGVAVASSATMYVRALMPASSATSINGP